MSCLHDNLIDAATRFPERTAFRCGGEEISYRGLDRRAKQFALYLKRLGVRHGDLVAIRSELSIEAVVAIYGILKCGAAYVPIDHESGGERVCRVLNEGRVKFLVALNLCDSVRDAIERDCHSLKTIVGIQSIVCIQELAVPLEETTELPQATELPTVSVSDTAYVIFTSGSTGEPKGIVHSHKSAQSYATLTAATYRLDGDDTIACVCPLHFDMSTFGLFAGVFSAATMVLIPTALRRFPASLSKLIEQHSISIWYSVPYALIQLMERGVLQQRNCSSLRWVVFAGESFPLKHLQQLRQAWPDASFSNAYGPAETNVCCVYQLLPWSQASDIKRSDVPIGKPWGNTEIIVVDGEDQPVAFGNTGQLLVHSETTMSRYWADEANQGAFFVCPDTHRRFYRTGDLVRQTPTGELLFLGRLDRQVKVRGYRIELDAVEAEMTSFPGVEEASVVCEERGGTHSLAATFTSRSSVDISEELRAWMRTRLPVYAIPDALVHIGEFPRTSSGKLDRRFLASHSTGAGFMTTGNEE